ncbi:transcription factor gte1 [Fagus crenata]
MKRRRVFRKTKTKRPSTAENKEEFEEFVSENTEDNDEFDGSDDDGDEEVDAEMEDSASSSNNSTGSDSDRSYSLNSAEDMSSEYSSYESSEESMEMPMRKLGNRHGKGKLKRVKRSRKSDYVKVIMKVMKMDEAKPFNVPVPPALETSDYFNVIDTPMDFGTICSNLQNGSKYMNSEDVFKDVQFIWRHWCKYSNKGDYVLELMRCVKKKFMKYWIAAGLYNEQTRKTNGHSLPPMHYGMRHRKYVAKYPGGLMIGRPNQSQPQSIYNQPCHSQQLQHSNVLNRPVGPMINKHSQTQPQQPELSLNQSYHLQQSQQTTSQAQPSHSQADTAGQSPTNSVMGCSNYVSSCPLGTVTNNLGPQQQPLECGNNQSGKLVCKRRKKRVRGPTLCRFLWDLSDGELIDVSINKFGQPIGPEAAKLSSFMGTIARNGYTAPLTYVSWRAVPDSAKEDMWQLVQSRFNIDPRGKSWVMKSLAVKWRDFKARVKAKYYYPYKTDEERLKHRDRRERTLTNKASRAKLKSVHTSGRKSYARIREEERKKKPNGEEPTRDEVYILTHTNKDGKPVNEEAAVKISKLRELASQQPKTSKGSNDPDDIFFQVMGQDKRGYMRTYGLGATPSDIWGATEVMRMASEAKRTTNAEMSKMVVKMEAMEQRYTHMEAHLTKMTSYMERFIGKHHTPLESRQVPYIFSGAPEESAHLDSS